MAIDSEYNGSVLVVTSIVLLVISTFAVSLRVFVRTKIVKAFATEDWLILIAQVNFILTCIFIMLGIHYGMGRHNSSLPAADRIMALMYQTLSTVTYTINMMFVKLSIAVFLLRLAVQRRYTWTLRISMVVVTIWCTFTFLFFIFECSPVRAQWDPTIQPATCAPESSFVAVAFAISVMSIVTDWMYALMPIFMIWSIRMNIQTKISVGIVLSLGIFASIATIVRLSCLTVLNDGSDLLFIATPAMVWTLIEPGVAITAASLITIRPLLRALHFPGFEAPSLSFPSFDAVVDGIDHDLPRAIDDVDAAGVEDGLPICTDEEAAAASKPEDDELTRRETWWQGSHRDDVVMQNETLEQEHFWVLRGADGIVRIIRKQQDCADEAGGDEREWGLIRISYHV